MQILREEARLFTRTPGQNLKDMSQHLKENLWFVNPGSIIDVVVAKGQLQRALRGEEVVFRNPVSDEDRRMQSYHRGYISRRVDTASMVPMERAFG